MSGRYDVLIAGAGPAGGHLARLLAARGRSVLLVDRVPGFQTNAFSSAGTILETMARYGIPEAVAGSRWRALEVASSKERGRWESLEPLGTVLDFGRLRAWLAEEAVARGAELLLGARCLGWKTEGEGARVSLERGKERFEVSARVVVDATGPARSLVRQGAQQAPQWLSGTGLELLVEAPPEVYARVRETLVFFLGERWMPGGYGWIFPMEEGLLKVGTGRYDAGNGRKDAGLRVHADLILREDLGIPGAKVVDVHGATLKYARGLKDLYAQGPVLAIGDAVSTLNVLGGEGIRHAMEGAEIALPFVLAGLESRGFSGYERAMKRRFARTWHRSEAMAIRKYLNEDDARFDQMVRHLRTQPIDHLMDLLFHYRFARVARRSAQALLWQKAKKLFGGRL